jgi:hypothetical protein
MADLLMKMPVPYEPKRQNRFILRFDSTLGINEWYVESAARPSLTLQLMLLVDLLGVLSTLSLETQLDLQHHKHLWNGFVFVLNL